MCLDADEYKGGGVRKISVDDPAHPDLTVGLWYPSEQPVAAAPNIEFGLSVALDAPIGTANGGLILISHSRAHTASSDPKRTRASSDATAPARTGRFRL